MERPRTFTPQTFTSASLGRCCVEANLTFFGLLSIADDEGRFVATPRYVLGHLYARRPTFTEADVKGWLAELESVGTIHLYVVKGITYGCFPNWPSFQRIHHPTASLLPEPPPRLRLLERADEEESGGEAPTTGSISPSEQDRLVCPVDGLAAQLSVSEPELDPPPSDDDYHGDDDYHDDYHDDDYLDVEWDPTTNGNAPDHEATGQGVLLVGQLFTAPVDKRLESNQEPAPEATPVATEDHSTVEDAGSGDGASASQPDPQADPPYFAEFLAAWEHYPRKAARKAAYKAYVARRGKNGKGIPASDLLAATKAYAAKCAAEGTEQGYMMLGRTFFGPNERWLDYLPSQPEPKPVVPAKVISPEAMRSPEELLTRSPYDPGAEEVGGIDGQPVDTCTWDDAAGTWTWVLLDGSSLWIADGCTGWGDDATWERALWIALPMRQSDGVAIGSGRPSWTLASRPLDAAEAKAAETMRNEGWRAARRERDPVFDTPAGAYALYQRLLSKARAAAEPASADTPPTQDGAVGTPSPSVTRILVTNDDPF